VTAKQAEIALIEDNSADVDLILLALRLSGIDVSVKVLPDGEQAFKYVDLLDSGSLHCPLLFVLDLNLPKRSGQDVLRKIRQSPVCSSIPVVVFSSSSADLDKREATRLGANSYFTKPADLDEFLAIGERFKPFLEKR
jgi:CheY-like chemotaxis protein